MKLDNKNELSKTEYRCELTKELDVLSKLTKNDYYDMFYHYVLADDLCIKDRCLAIRVPGGTVGSIWIDENNVITDIKIDTDYVVKTYPNNINELMQKFINQAIEF